MEDTDSIVFTSLFKAAYEICFNQPLRVTLGETESKLFANQLLDKTGLTIGWRSLKNFSIFICGTPGIRKENPSIATLDTLARYVLRAPYTNEITRKEEEDHHPYWFMYREQQLELAKKDFKTLVSEKARFFKVVSWILASFLLAAIIVTSIWYMTKSAAAFTDNFQTTGEQQMATRGWRVDNKDLKYWLKNNVHSGALTLFTLDGDSWPDSNATSPKIKNLLMRSLSFNCFSAELHFINFIPKGEWQQAGLLLLQDTSLKSPSVRLSLAYNDNFGGYHRPAEIIAQAIYSTGTGLKPEEFAHRPILTLDSAAKIPALLNNLRYSAIRIERQGQHYRFLCSGGAKSNAAFKEIAVKDLPFEPHYIGVFAFKGNVTNSAVIPVTISSFAVQEMRCN